jgi:hypothetical protein
LSNEKKYNYVYKQTRDNGEYYIGIHSSELESDQYNGSGTIFKNKYNADPDSFTMEILYGFETRLEASDMEGVLVTEETLRDPLCLNLKTGGQHGIYYHTEAHKEKMSFNMAGSKNHFSGKKHTAATKKKMSETRTGKKIHTEAHKNMLSVNITGSRNPMASDKKHTIVHKEHGQFTGTQIEIRAAYPDVTPDGLSKLVLDKQQSHKGWTVKNNAV